MASLKTRFFLFGAIFVLVFLYLTIKEIGNFIGFEISGSLHILCMVLTVISIIGIIAVAIAIGSRIKRKKDLEDGGKGPCPVCNSRMIYVDGSGWYCQNCMDYRK